jgi:hypothetical protein
MGIEKDIESLFNDYGKTYSFVLSSSNYLKNNLKMIGLVEKYIEILSKSKLKEKYISLKLNWFTNKNGIDNRRLRKVIRSSQEKNITIIFSSFLKKYREDEIKTYLKFQDEKFSNIYITLACYHKDIDEKVDFILKIGGKVRLVKGWWNDGNEKNWDTVTENYKRNAEKLIKDGNYHILATHDFDILEEFYKKHTNKMDNLEISFFYSNRNYVLTKLKDFRYEIKNKSFYKVYGSNLIGLYFFLTHSNLKRNLPFTLNSI